MANPYTISSWDYRDKHVDSSISQESFLSAARSLIYTAPRKTDGQVSTFSRIGVVQGYQWQEGRSIQQIFELGSDIPYLVPGRTEGSIGMNRILIYGADIINALYSDGTAPTQWIKSLKDITVPFDLMLATYSVDGEKSYGRVFTNALIASRSESIGAGQITIAESVSIQYESISSASLA